MNRPLPLLVTAYAAGLAAAYHAAAGFQTLCVALAAAGCMLAVALRLRRRALATGAAALLFVLFGALAIHPIAHPTLPAHHVAAFIGHTGLQVEGLVDHSPVSLPEGLRITVRAERIHTRSGSTPATGLVRLTLRSTGRDYRYGDRLRFACTLKAPRNFENPGGFDYVRFLSRRSVYATAFLRDDRRVVTLARRQGNPALMLAERYRDRVREAITAAVDPPGASVLHALILGEKSAVPRDIHDCFARLGVAHLLAISGLHIGIVSVLFCATFMGLVRWHPHVLLRMDARRLAIVLSLPPVFLYCLVAGCQLPTLRACLMLLAYAAMLISGRSYDLLNTLFLAAFAILLLMPESLLEPSFQLSFSAVAALVLLLPPLQNALQARACADGHGGVRRVFVRSFLALFLVSAVALAGTAPLVAYYFQRVSGAGLIANLALVPLTGFVVLPLGLAASMLVPLSDTLSGLMFTAAGWAINQLVTLMHQWAQWPVGEIRAPRLTVVQIACMYLLLFGMPLCLQRKKRVWLAAAVAVVFIVHSAVYPGQGHSGDMLRVTFFDVGKGDAALVEFPDGQTMLIDGGGLGDEAFDIGRSVLAPALSALGVRRVDYIVLSHPHQDHAGGLGHIAENFGPRELWINGETADAPFYTRLMRAAQHSRALIQVCSSASAPVSIGGVEVSVLGPPPGSVTPGQRLSGDTNNLSLVLKLSFGTTSFLFTGDILEQREQQLVAGDAALQAAIIKVPHHGRKGSSSAAFVRAVAPEVAIVSGSTHDASACVVKRYRLAGARIFCTGAHGAITVTATAGGYSVLPRLPAGRREAARVRTTNY